MARILVSFASRNLSKAHERLRRQAQAFSSFTDIQLWNEADLPPEFRAHFKHRLKAHVRGFGFWCWKPQILMQTLQAADPGDEILYIDAGCHLNAQAEDRLEHFFAALDPDFPIAGFDGSVDGTRPNALPEGDYTEAHWTKEDLFGHYHVP